MGFLSDLFDPGKQNRDAASQFTRDAQVTGGSASGPGGISAGFNFDSNGRGSINTGLGSFNPLLGQTQGLANFGFGLAQQGLGQGLQDLGAGAIGDMQGVDLQRFGNFGGAQALQSILGGSAGIASANPFALGQGVTEQLRGRSTRSNQNLVNQKFDKLFASGGLSNSVTREQVTGDLSRQLDDQDLGFQLAGLDAGRGMQQEAFGRSMGAFGGLEGFGSRLFGEGAQQTQLNAGLAQSRFGIGQALQQMQIQQMMAGGQLGQGALGAGMSLSQLPLQFLQSMMSAQGLRSDAALGAAGAQSQLASQASSPLLGALGAVGQFGSAIGGFGGLGGAIGGLFGGGGGGGGGGQMGGFGGFSGGLDISHLLRGVGGGQ